MTLIFTRKVGKGLGFVNHERNETDESCSIQLKISSPFMAQ